MAISVVRWPLWRIPAAALALVLLIDTAGVVLPFRYPTPVHFADVRSSVLLASLAVAYAVATTQWERIRRSVGAVRNPSGVLNLLTCWTFAAALVLPPQLAAAVIVVAYLGEWPARRVNGDHTLHRLVFSCATVLLATSAVWFEREHLPEVAVLPLAVVTFTAVNLGAVMLVAVLTSRSDDVLSVFTSVDKHLLELQTLGVGLLVALLMQSNVPLVWLSLPAAILLQHRAARRSLVAGEAVTAAMGHNAWNLVAREIVSACPAAAIVRIDTDSAEAVNAVARMQAGCDAVGRFRSSGLAIALADCPPEQAEAVAARLRSALANQQIQATVAVAAKPRDGQRLADLLAVSEAELITRAARPGLHTNGRPGRP